MASEKAAPMLLDFTNVRDRGDYNPVHVEPGEYLMKITAVVSQDSKNSKPMWVFAFAHAAPVAGNPSATRATYPFYCVLEANVLWKVRGLAIAAGYNVPKSKFQLDPNRLVGRTIGVIVDDDEYEGKVRSKVVQVMPAAELDAQPATGGTDDEDPDSQPEQEPDLEGVDDL